MMAAARLHRHLLTAATLLAAASAIAAPNTKVFIGNNSSLPPIRRSDGSQLTPRALRGHTVLVNFWASWCVACRTELPSLERLAAKRGDLLVIAASVDTDHGAALKAFAGRYPHLNLAFASLDEVQQYGALGMPYSVILDKEGREVMRMPRALEWDRAEGRSLLMRARSTRSPRQTSVGRRSSGVVSRGVLSAGAVKPERGWSGTRETEVHPLPKPRRGLLG